MPKLDDSIKLQGTLATLGWEDKEITALNGVSSRTVGTATFKAAGKLVVTTAGSALYHHTTPHQNISVVWSKSGDEYLIWAVGGHAGRTNKKYKVYTWQSGTKQKTWDVS